MKTNSVMSCLKVWNGLLLMAFLLTPVLATPAQRKPEPERLTPAEIEQLADVVLRNDREFRKVAFRYTLAWFEGDKNQRIILVVHEYPRFTRDHDLEVFSFRRGECMRFVQENYGQVSYGKRGPDVGELGWGGMMATEQYWRGIRHIRETPLIVAERKNTKKTCARLKRMEL